MQTFQQQCVTLRKKDHTLPEIVKITGRPKTSVFFHIQRIPLSQKKQRAVKRASGEHIRKFAAARKGKSTRSFKRFSHWTPRTVLLISHLLFDGEINQGGCVYHNRSTALTNRFVNLMSDLYHFNPSKSKNSQTGVIRIAYYNVELSAYFKNKSQLLLKEILKLPLAHQRECLRAFFDDEGCMDFRKKIRRVRGYQKDVDVLILIQALLAKFDIESKIKKPNEIMIIGKENLIKFQKEINFSPGVRINGNRSNSIWKKSLQKRDILKAAIHSFKT